MSRLPRDHRVYNKEQWNIFSFLLDLHHILLSLGNFGTHIHPRPMAAKQFGWVGLGWVGLGWVGLGWLGRVLGGR